MRATASQAPHAPRAPSVDLARVRAIAREARATGRTHLLEPDARALVEAIGIAVPRAVFVEQEADAARAVEGLPGDRVVIRVVAPGILHKTEVGGVLVAPRDVASIRAAMGSMRATLGDWLTGWMVAEHVVHDPGAGGSLLASVRWTEDAGPVVSIGAGGIDAEALAADLRPGRELAVLSPALTPRMSIASILSTVTAVRLATVPQRGQPARLPMARLVEVVERLFAVGASCVPDDILELELNPLVVTPDGLVALDVLVAVGGGPRPPASERPREKLARLLEPRSAAIMGVSAGENPGHTILRNFLRDGFDPDVLTVVKPGIEWLDGCRCVPDIASLPGKVDLFVVALSAAASADALVELVERDAAETIIVIAGGLEEKHGSEAIVSRMHAALAASRDSPGRGPLIIGGNCLGIRSVPGRYDTLFIPSSRLAPPAGAAPLAIVAQSGAFAISRLSRLADLHPRYVVTVGNQMDLTVGDFLDYLAGDPALAVFAVYVEGFRPLDAVRFLEAASRIAASGRTVILYRAGRTTAGARMSASHTASIAGDEIVLRELARGAHVLDVDSLDAFDDVARTATLLHGRAIAGRRVGAMSNAGFECVAIADNVGSLELAAFDTETERRLADALAGEGASDIVDVHNPLDVTPMAGDTAFVAMAAAVIASPAVDVGVIGLVPLSAELHTLGPGPGPEDHGDLDREDAVAAGLVDLWRRTTKAWVVVVDAGPLYDPLVGVLEAAGIPVFRTADRAMRALGAVVTRGRRAD